MKRTLLASALLLGFTTLRADAARAQSRLGPQGSAIQTSNYSVDLFQGPVLATARITGLGGAYVAIAEGTEGIAFNPAAASLRPVYSTTYLDYDFSAGATLPSSVNGTDFDNDGRKGFRYNNFVWGTLGGTLQIGKLGIGAVLAGQNYSLGAPSSGPAVLPGGIEAVDGLTVRVLRLDAVASYGFLDEQLHVGAGPRLASLFGVGNAKQLLPSNDGSVSLGDAVGERLLFGTTGIGAQGGALWSPHTLPVRAGLTVRSPIVSSTTDSGSRIKEDASGNRVIGSFYLPRKASLPWEVEWGISFQVGARAYNGRWQNEDKLVGPEVDRERRKTAHGEFREPAFLAARRILQRRAAALPRPLVLVSASALVTGPSSNAVGLESMLEQRVQRSGQRATLGVRVGAELELIPRWTILRAGSYLEPTRFRATPSGASVDVMFPNPRPRLHATAGLQQKLFAWDVWGLFSENTEWRVSLAGDVGRQYFGWGLGLGVWH